MSSPWCQPQSFLTTQQPFLKRQSRGYLDPGNPGVKQFSCEEAEGETKLSPAVFGPSAGSPNKFAMKDSLEWSHPSYLEMIGRPMPSNGFATASLTASTVSSVG